MTAMKMIFAMAAAALVLTSCGSGGDSSAPGSTPSAPAGSLTTSPAATPTPSPTKASPSVTPTPKPKPAPKPTAKPKPKAKNGTKLAACRDADCQVEVPGKITIKFSGGKLKITKIGKFVHFKLSGQYGGASGQLGTTGTMTFDGYGMSGTFGGTKPAPRSDDPPGLTLRVLYVGGGVAILDLHHVSY